MSRDAQRDATARRAWEAMGALVLDHDRRREVSAALDLSFARVRTLRRVAAKPMTGRELAAVLGTDPPNVSAMVDDLEARGLVERTPHPSDRRAKLVTATASGKRAAAKAEKLLMEPPAALRDLPAEDLAALDRILEALRAER